MNIADNRALLNAIPDLMFRINRDGTYLDFKSSDKVDLFVPPGQFLSKRVVDVDARGTARRVMQSITAMLGPETRSSRNLRLSAAINGRLNYYETRITASGPNEALMLVRDITQRKRVEEAWLRTTDVGASPT
ncbi:MAG: PAS domain-containing protein [Anaerolineae bacterium]